MVNAYHVDSVTPCQEHYLVADHCPFFYLDRVPQVEEGIVEGNSSGNVQKPGVTGWKERSSITI
ncbi:MAG: hypothetical protein ACUVS4_08525 [Chloroflexaceae bacterium]